MTPGLQSNKRPGRELERNRKKPRDENYAKGSVVRVKVHNFMTYQDAVIPPGPKLNLVLGPNGTGKSSFVCALCVGLGGSTKLLGRADNVADFVRRGKREGWVEVTLSGGKDKPDIVVRRTINVENKSTWKIGRETVNKNAVAKKMQELNVQLDNLCQFLPQDKVVEFAKLKPTELLQETEKAIGDARLYDLHTKLIDKRNDLKDREKSKEALETTLAQLQMQNQSLQRDVQRFQEREKLLKQVAVINKKLKYLQTKEYEEDYQKAVSAFDSNKKSLAKKEKELKTAEAPLDRKREEMNEAKRYHDKLQAEGRIVEKKMAGENSSLEQRLQDAHTAIENKYDELDSLESEAAKRIADIKDAEAKLKRAQDHFETIPPLRADLEEEMEMWRNKLRDLDQQVKTFEYETHDFQAQLQDTVEAEVRRLQEQQKRLADVKQQRLNLLDRRFHGLREQYEWVQQNKQRFKAVYGPIGLEVSVQNPHHAKILENHIPLNVWSFFVVTDPEDQKAFISEVQRATGQKPSVTWCRVPAPGPMKHPDGEASSYQQYGIDATLDQVFEAPDIIKQVLCNERGINTTYVANRTLSDAKAAGKFLDDNPQIKCLYTPQDGYRVFGSLYSNVRSKSSFGLRDSRYFAGGGGSDAQRQKIEQELQLKLQEKAELDSELRAKFEMLEQLKKEHAAAQEKEDNLKKEKQRHGIGKSKAAQAVRGCQSVLDMRIAVPNPYGKAPAIKREIEVRSQRALKLVQEICRQYAQFWKITKKLTVAKLAWKEKDMQVKAMQQHTKDAEQEVKSLRSRHNMLRSIVEDAKRELQKAQEDMQGFTLTDKLRAKFEELPDDVGELQQQGDSKSAEADGIVCSNPQVLDEYNKRQQQIRDNERKLAHETEVVSTMQQDIERIKGEWLPELEEVVKLISATFSQNFKRIGCAGEVNLQTSEDFDKYAIEIKVKFRENEGLDVLTANRQSGGERSVSTMMYLISIQGVTVTPFRVVDEINQGMDPINERKVFTQLVESACREGTPQCFLLTPKLLPGLEFSEHVTVLQIMNGPFIGDVANSFTQKQLYAPGRRLGAAE